MGELLRTVREAFDGSSGDATTALFERLRPLGPAGLLAVDLYRAVKASQRAKVYRGRPGRGGPSYRNMAYEKKAWAMDNACKALSQHAEAIGMAWGWGYDAASVNFEHVLYFDLPTGQVSLHSPHRGAGPDYAGAWDGVRNAAAGRLCAWIANLLEPARAAVA